MNGRLLHGRSISVRLVDEVTNHEDMFGEDTSSEAVRPLQSVY
eukprot:COSAG01_NODE_8148_length_2903_cov_2.324893_5_plen_43_part_00